MWWSSAHTYKNAITNELFLHLSAKLYNRFKDAKYLDNAKKASSCRYTTAVAGILTICVLTDMDLA